LSWTRTGRVPPAGLHDPQGLLEADCMMVRDALFCEVLASPILSVVGGRSAPRIAMEMAEKLVDSLKDLCLPVTWEAAHGKGAQVRYEVRWRVIKGEAEVSPMVACRRADAWHYAAYHVFRHDCRIAELELWREDE